MLIELKTKRRWILSILETASKEDESRVVVRAVAQQTGTRRHVMVHPTQVAATRQPVIETGR